MTITGIDHLVIVVRDLERARAVYGRLGFTLSPRGEHSPPLGTANHTIMAQRDYLELLAVTTETASNLGYREALAEGEGIVSLALAAPDATSAHAAWQAAGLHPEEILRFSRPVARPSGDAIEARFEITRLPPRALPGAEVFVCGHLTREAVWLPELLDHPNTAVALRGVTIAVPDPGTAAAAWARALCVSSVAEIAGGLRITVGAQTIDLVDPRSAAARVGTDRLPRRAGAVAMDLAVRDLSACRAALARGGVPFREAGDRLLVAPEHAAGVAIAWAAATR
jgi:catechol 2,3-dioxygenase-like lactoylglutathione lyase family enzyme